MLTLPSIGFSTYPHTHTPEWTPTVTATLRIRIRKVAKEREIQCQQTVYLSLCFCKSKRQTEPQTERQRHRAPKKHDFLKRQTTARTFKSYKKVHTGSISDEMTRGGGGIYWGSVDVQVHKVKAKKLLYKHISHSALYAVYLYRLLYTYISHSFLYAAYSIQIYRNIIPCQTSQRVCWLLQAVPHSMMQGPQWKCKLAAAYLRRVRV